MHINKTTLVFPFYSIYFRFLFFPLVNFEVVILSLVLTILLIYKSLNHIFLVVLCVVNCICITHVSTSSLYYIIHTLLSDSKSIAYMFGMWYVFRIQMRLIPQLCITYTMGNPCIERLHTTITSCLYCDWHIGLLRNRLCTFFIASIHMWHYVCCIHIKNTWRYFCMNWYVVISV